MTGKGLREWRTASGLSQGEVALVCGVAVRTVRRWEQDMEKDIPEGMAARITSESVLDVPSRPMRTVAEDTEDTGKGHKGTGQEGTSEDIGRLRSEIEALRRRVEALEARPSGAADFVEGLTDVFRASTGYGQKAKVYGESGNPKMGMKAEKRKVDEFSQEVGWDPAEASQEWRRR